MPYDYLILDWSGVVSNDAPIIFPIVNKIHAHFKRQLITFQEFQDAYEGDILKYYRDRNMDVTTVQTLFREHYGSAGQPQPIPGAPRAVRMASRIVTVGVFSSHPQPSLEREIERYQLRKHITYADGGVNKAHVDDLKKHLHRTRTKNPLYAGDTAFDIAIANQLGIASAAVISTHGYHREEHFARVTPTYRISHISELEPVLKNGQSH